MARVKRLRSYGFVFPRFLRMESPRISMRWALWTKRSRIPSAHSWVADLLVPTRHGHLRGKDHTIPDRQNRTEAPRYLIHTPETREFLALARWVRKGYPRA